MARPIKRGFDYFPFDVGFFRSLKIRIIMARFGADGIILYIYLLTVIYSEKGYYAEYNDDLIDIAAADLNMKPQKIGQIINFFCKRSLFDSTLFTTDKVLSSTGIQKRYQEMVKSRAVRKEIAVNAKFWILEKEETQSFIKVHPHSDFSEKNKGFSEKNIGKSEENDIKESKVNKSKVNETISASDIEKIQEIVLLYERICNNVNDGLVYVDIDNISDTVKRNIVSCINDGVNFIELFKKVKLSEFLTSSSWCNLSWIVKLDNARKILSGRYDNKPKSQKGERKATSYNLAEIEAFDEFK